MKDDKKIPEKDAATSKSGAKKLIFDADRIINQFTPILQSFLQRNSHNSNLFETITTDKIPKSLKYKIDLIENEYGREYRDLRILSALTKEFSLSRNER